MSSNLIIDDYIREQVVTTPEKPLYSHNHKTWFYTGMFKQKKFYEMASKSFLLYCLLRSNVIRGNVKSPFYKRIKSEYYDNGHIVCALSQREISEKTGWYRSKVIYYVDDLIDKRFIRVDKIDVGKYKKQHIYLLGRTSNSGDDRYYIDEIINSS